MSGTADHGTAWLVVIPAFNAKDTIARAVLSAAAQTSPGQVLVIDDGSTDDTPRLARDAGARVVTQDNAGPSAARNRGIDECRGANVLFLDADDELAAGAIARLRDTSQARRAWSCIVGSHEEVRRDNAGESVVLRRPRADWIRRGELPHAALALGTDHVFCTTGLAVSAPTIAAGLRFDTALWFGEDRDFVVRAGAIGPIGVTDAVMVRKHQPPGQMTASPRGALRWLRDQIRLADKHAPGPGSSTAHQCLRPALEWTARNTLRSLARRRELMPAQDWVDLRRAFRSRGWAMPIACWRWRLAGVLVARRAPK